MTTVVEIDAGADQGIPVSIIAFIYGPFHSDNIDVLASMVCNLSDDKRFHDPKFYTKDSDEIILNEIKLDDIEFHYEHNVLNNLANGIHCIQI